MNAIKKYTNNKLILPFLIITLGFQAHAYEPDEGQVAPDFEITQADGTTFKLSEYKSKKSVYVIFWNTWCHYCMKKTPKLLATEKNLSDNIKIIAINTSRQDSVEEMLAFKKRFNVTYSLAFDNNEVITDLYNVHGVPTEFIIDINGIIRHRDNIPDNISVHLAEWNTVQQKVATNP